MIFWFVRGQRENVPQASSSAINSITELFVELIALFYCCFIPNGFLSSCRKNNIRVDFSTPLVGWETCSTTRLPLTNNSLPSFLHSVMCDVWWPTGAASITEHKIYKLDTSDMLVPLCGCVRRPRCCCVRLWHIIIHLVAMVCGLKTAMLVGVKYDPGNPVWVTDGRGLSCLSRWSQGEQ